MIGISLYMLPKIRGQALTRYGAGWAVWAFWTFGVALRWWVGISGWHWRLGLVASAVAELSGFGLMQYLLLSTIGRAKAKESRAPAPKDLGSWMGIVGAAALALALFLNLVISIHLAFDGAMPVYPAVANQVFLTIALWGFAVPFAWGYSTRLVTVFLGLERPEHRVSVPLAATIAVGIGLMLAHRTLAASLVFLIATAVAIWALRVFRPSVTEPKRLAVYRHYPWFVRLSYVWLAVGAILGVLAELFPAATGLGGASRHAATVGFLATLIFSLGPRILPSFLNSRQLYSRSLMAATLWIISTGCLLRVSSESIAYSSGGAAWALLPVSAVLELLAVTIFVVNMAMTLKQAPPTWFLPERATAEVPVYFYINSYPATRRVLIGSGLKTLEQVRQVPRSLTLAEAAAADGADLAAVLSDLRAFFASRQPRR